MAEERTCVGCDGGADFTVNLVAYLLRKSPKVATSTKSIGVCTPCVTPGSPNYEKVGKIMVCWLMQVNNDLDARAAGSVDVDRKSAAGGA